MNYHFRTKEALYHEVLLEACRADSVSLNDQEKLLKLDPRKALFILVKESLKEYRKQTTSNWRIVVITRECREPSHAFEAVVREYFKPESDFVAQLIGKAVNKPPTDHCVRFALLGMIGLLETFGFYRHLIDAIAPGLDDHFKMKDGLTHQIVHLVLEAANPSIKDS